jgi:hypothetical protein
LLGLHSHTRPPTHQGFWASEWSGQANILLPYRGAQSTCDQSKQLLQSAGASACVSAAAAASAEESRNNPLKTWESKGQARNEKNSGSKQQPRGSVNNPLLGFSSYSQHHPHNLYPEVSKATGREST